MTLTLSDSPTLGCRRTGDRRSSHQEIIYSSETSATLSVQVKSQHHSRQLLPFQGHRPLKLAPLRGRQSISRANHIQREEIQCTGWWQPMSSRSTPFLLVLTRGWLACLPKLSPCLQVTLNRQPAWMPNPSS